MGNPSETEGSYSQSGFPIQESIWTKSLDNASTPCRAEPLSSFLLYRKCSPRVQSIVDCDVYDSFGVYGSFGVCDRSVKYFLYYQ